MQDFGDVIAASSEHVAHVRPIGYETASFWKIPEQGNEGKPFGDSKLADSLRREKYEGGR
jgi:hypothetical protein